MTTTTGTRATAAPVSRRQRLRDATTEEIKAVARELMSHEGTASLNLRAIAREMGMTPSALYRYYPSRDAILTALITDAYDSVGDAVERAVEDAPDGDPCSGILAACHAFRRWALDHPQEYGLIYGAPVPGYEAPPEETVEAAMRCGMALLALLQQGVAAGVVVLPPVENVPDDVAVAMEEFARMKGHGELPLSGAVVAMQFWVVLLGLISGEVFCHLPPSLVVSGASFFDFSLRRTLVAVGADPDRVAAAVSPN